MISIDSRKGAASSRIEQADGGTLFLDEIGDMPEHLQTRLLRVLQVRCNVRLGGQRETKLNLLVIAASHRDLTKLVAAGRFRDDLYFRLDGVKIRLPALREREDFDALIDTFLQETALGKPALPRPSQALLRKLKTYASSPMPAPTQMPVQQMPEPAVAAMSAGSPARAPNWRLYEMQRQWLDRALAEHGGNVAADRQGGRHLPHHALQVPQSMIPGGRARLATEVLLRG